MTDRTHRRLLPLLLCACLAVACEGSDGPPGGGDAAGSADLGAPSDAAAVDQSGGRDVAADVAVPADGGTSRPDGDAAATPDTPPADMARDGTAPDLDAPADAPGDGGGPRDVTRDAAEAAPDAEGGPDVSGPPDTGGGLPSGMGAACTTQADCADYEASYCAVNALTGQGKCTVSDCLDVGCPTTFRCCDCAAIALEDFCVDAPTAEGILATLCACE